MPTYTSLFRSNGTTIRGLAQAVPNLEEKLKPLGIFQNGTAQLKLGDMIFGFHDSTSLAMHGMAELGCNPKPVQSQLQFPSVSHILESSVGRRLETPQPPFMKLPFDIISIIIRNLDASDAANIALVSRDCQLLARSRQFTVVRLDFSIRSFSLLIHLYNELQQQLSGKWGCLTKSPSLGSCIHGIRVVTDPKTFSDVTMLGKLQLPWDRLSRLKKTRHFQPAVLCYHEFYLRLLEEILAHPRALPFLEFFEWADNTSISTPLITSLAHSNVKSLILSHPLVDDGVSIRPHKFVGEEEWPLKDLRIDLRRAPKEMSLHSARGTSPLCASILCQCAPTLENLIWRTSGAAGNDPQTLGTDLSRIPRFPKLRRFELDDSVVFADAQTLNSPIGGPYSLFGSQYWTRL
jgi:hypothetical protein